MGGLSIFVGEERKAPAAAAVRAKGSSPAAPCVCDGGTPSGIANRRQISISVLAANQGQASCRTAVDATAKFAAAVTGTLGIADGTATDIATPGACDMEFGGHTNAFRAAGELPGTTAPVRIRL